MPENSKNIAIGFVVVCSLAILAWTLLFLHPSFGDEKFKLHARFAMIDKVNVGSRVTYAGRAVGKVIEIYHLPQEPRALGNSDAPIYIYDLLLGIDSHIPIYDCDEISIGTSGLMGERFISIIPKHPDEKPARLLTNNEIVFAEKPVSMEETLGKLSNTVTHLEQITSSLSSSSGIQSLISSATTMCDTINATTIAFAASAPKLESIGDETIKTAQSLQSLMAQISSGEGSVGKILTDDDVYLKMVGILNKIDILMNDINRYGALFHLNKNWQRENKKAEKELIEKD